MTDKINLDEIRADMLAGTPGPWRWKGGSAFSVQQGNGPHVARIYMWDVTAKAEADARRIARLPALEHAYLDAIARAEVAEAELDNLRSLLRASLERDVSGDFDWQIDARIALNEGEGQ